MNLFRISSAILLAAISGPALALSIAVDPETGEPVENPPSIFLTLYDEAGEVAGDYTLAEFSFHLAPNPEGEDSYSNGRPRFSFIGVERLDSALIEWARADAGGSAPRSVTIEVLPEDVAGTALRYTIQDVVVHHITAFHLSDGADQSAAAIEISASDFSLEEREIQRIEN